MTKEDYAQQGLADGRRVSFQIRQYRVLATEGGPLAPEESATFTPPPTLGENI
jgi:hypothetical protein